LEWYLGWIDQAVLQGANEDSIDVYIWFDTLCIPLATDDMTEAEQQKAGKLKTKAISTMAFVYAAAMQVLVIDQTLREVSLHKTGETGDLDLATRMLTSPWMSRAWTFQEGSLARHFSILLADTLLSPRKWWTAMPHRCDTQAELVLKAECLTSICSIPDVMNSGVIAAEARQDRFAAVWNQLARRDTTKPEDIHGLLAVMLDLSAREVLETGSSEELHRRMMAIVRSQESLPLSMLLFPYPSNEYTKLVPGHEWLPTYPSGTMVPRLGSMSWTADGTGLAFSQSETMSALFILEKSLAADISMFVSTPDAEALMSVDQVAVKVKRLGIQNGQLQHDEARYKGKTLCIFLHAFLNPEIPVCVRAAGACFTLENRDDADRLHVAFLYPIEYQRTPSGLLARPAAKQVLSSNQESEVIEMEPVFTDAVCVLKCGGSKLLLFARIRCVLTFTQTIFLGQSWTTGVPLPATCREAFLSPLQPSYLLFGLCTWATYSGITPLQRTWPSRCGRLSSMDSASYPAGSVALTSL
jgi:hypothetical protein